MRIEPVAVACDVTAATVWNWEAGKGSPRASQLSAIAYLTGRPLEFFFSKRFVKKTVKIF